MSNSVTVAKSQNKRWTQKQDFTRATQVYSGDKEYWRTAWENTGTTVAGELYREYEYERVSAGG